MLYFTLFLVEIVSLFFLSRRLQRSMGTAIYKITRNRKLSIYIMAALFMPGTFVHEMAHFLAALFLLVPVGNMKLLPEISDDSIKLGSVGIAKTDPIRRFIIGAAPFFSGILIILAVIYLVWNSFGSVQEFYSFKNLLLLFTSLYIVFTVGNTMFSSKKDMEGMWGFLAFLILSGVVMWIFNINLKLDINISTEISGYFLTACIFLLVPLGLDIIAVTILNKR